MRASSFSSRPLDVDAVARRLARLAQPREASLGTALPRMEADGSASWRARVDRDEDDASDRDPASGREDDAPKSRLGIVNRIQKWRNARQARPPKVTREFLERADDVKLRKMRKRCATALRLIELAQPKVDVNDLETGRGLSVEDSRVEQLARALATGDKERKRALEGLRAIDAVLERRKQHKETKYTRRIEAIPRDATRLIDEYNMKRFIHRGIDVEGLDNAAFRQLFDRCLEGLGSESLTRERLIPVEHLTRLVRRGDWDQYWQEYSEEAMKQALWRGLEGTAVALYAIADTNPLAEDEFGGVPGASTLLDSPSAYVWCLLQLLTLPLIAPIASAFSYSLRRTLHMLKFIFASPVWRARHQSSSFVVLFVYYAPYWLLGFVTTLWYISTSHADDIVMDGVMAIALSFMVTSFVAMAMSSADVKNYSKMSAVTLFFPGGKTELPDAESKLVQEHPTVDSLRVREIPVTVRAPVTESNGMDASSRSEERDTTNDDSKAAPRKNGKSGAVPRWIAEMNEFSESIELKTTEKSSRGKKNAQMGRNGATSARRDSAHVKDSIEDIVSKNKLLQLQSVTERDVLAVILERTITAERKSYWLGSPKRGWIRQVVFLLAAVFLSLIPFIIRGAKGESMFGVKAEDEFCIRDSITDYVPSVFGLAACPAGTQTMVGFVSSHVNLLDGASKNYGVVMAFFWNVTTLFAIFNLSRWVCAIAYHDMLHWLFFHASTDPTLAAEYNVPYVNLTQAWLPWIRIRMVVEDHRELEQYWCQYYLMHLVFFVSLVIAVGFVDILRLYLLFDVRAVVDMKISTPIFPLVIAAVLSVPIIVIVSTASKVYEIQQMNIVSMQEARWKLFLDNSTILNAGLHKEKADILSRNDRSITALKELETIVERRNAEDWPIMFGLKLGDGALAASYALGFVSVALAMSAIAIEVFQRYVTRASATSAPMSDILRVGLASISGALRVSMNTP